MAPFAVSDDIAAVLTLKAKANACSTDDLLRGMLFQMESEERVTAYSPEVLAHLQRGIDEANRGEFVSAAETQAFFDDWRRNG